MAQFPISLADTNAFYAHWEATKQIRNNTTWAVLLVAVLFQTKNSQSKFFFCPNLVLNVLFVSLILHKMNKKKNIKDRSQVT